MDSYNSTGTLKLEPTDVSEANDPPRSFKASKRNFELQGRQPEERLYFVHSNCAMDVDNSSSGEVSNEGFTDADGWKLSKSIKGEREFIKLDSDEEWDRFFEMQNDPSRNTTNREAFSPVKGVSHYHGKEIVGKIADQIKAEIAEAMNKTLIGSIMIKEGKREENVVYPTVRVILSPPTMEGINIFEVLSGDICQKYKVKTITFCHPIPEGKRGACCYIRDDGVRVYEIVSGFYEMTIKWYVDGEECKIKIAIDDRKGVSLLEGNGGVTAEQLRANEKVKVGKRREPKSLYEACAGVET